IEATVGRLGQILAEIGVSVEADPEPAASMPKQDRSSTLSEKVENWDAFERSLEDRRLLDLAMGYFFEPTPATRPPGGDGGETRRVWRAARDVARGLRDRYPIDRTRPGR